MSALSSSPTNVTSKRQRLSSFGENLNGQEDFRFLYNSSARKQSIGWGSTRSLSTVNTDDGACSTSTEPMSNTFHSREKKQREKRRFLSFTKVLMKFLEKKNPTVCKNARKVIRKYKSSTKQENHSDYEGEDDSESMCESIRVPLKETVGPAYWKQAKGYLNEIEAHENEESVGSTTQASEDDLEPLHLGSSTNAFTDSQLEALSQFANSSSENVHTENQKERFQPSRKRPSRSQENQLERERKLRKHRFWMVVRVLMKYLERKDFEAYQKARAALKDCARRHSNGEEGYANLISSVQRTLKCSVGIFYWKKSERHVAKYLIQKANERVLDDAIAQEAASFNSLDHLKVEHNPVALPSAFVPPREEERLRWRIDPSIPTNVSVPAKRSAENWTNDHRNHNYTSPIRGDQQAYYPNKHPNDFYPEEETTRKRRKLWSRPLHFRNG